MKLLVSISLAQLAFASAFFFPLTKPSSTPNAGEVAPPIDMRTRGIAPHLLEKYSQSTFQCDGKILSADSINDDYCDCADGTDEPGTNACSTGTFYCVNKGYRIIKMPTSRVDDGVCDCCDGSDENRGHKCLDICSSVASSERVMLEQLTNNYKQGSEIRRGLIDKVTKEAEEQISALATIQDSVVQHQIRLGELRAQKSEEDAQIEADAKKREEVAVVVAKKLLKLDTVRDDHLAGYVLGLFKSLSIDSSHLVEALVKSFRGEEQTTHKHELEADNNDDHYGQDLFAVDEVGEIIHEDEEDAVAAAREEPVVHVTAHPPACPLMTSDPSGANHPLLASLCLAIGLDGSVQVGDASSLFPEIRSLIYFTVKQRGAYDEAQLLAGYYSLHQSFEGFEDFYVTNQFADVIPDPSSAAAASTGLCPPAFQQGGVELCSVSRSLSNVFDNMKNSKQGVARPASAALDEAVRVEEDLERQLRETEKVKRDLEAHSDHLAYLAIRDECMEVVDAKFTYKVCVMGSVTQTEDGSHSSVTLGDFESVEEDDQGNGATLKFRHGQHCHAFGARSADVKVTCGSANKLISASEPSTCFYSFQMESPAACTPKFAEFSGIYI